MDQQTSAEGQEGLGARGTLVLSEDAVAPAATVTPAPSAGEEGPGDQEDLQFVKE